MVKHHGCVFMINKTDNPAEWSLLKDEIGKAIELVEFLEIEITTNSEINEKQIKGYLTLIYILLNRIWNSRNHIGERTEQQLKEYTEFPTDIECVYRQGISFFRE